MNKNFMDKLTFLIMACTLLFFIFVSGVIVKNIHDISFNMGVLIEKVGTLEEQNPTIVRK